ncbi:hypothetical protein [Luteococcus sp. OSA5]|uniref:hypothetical protein n=1 Tax=Luteococcus sp. OSA5 TaxID=3401630 RepID=UPI003B430E71
MTGTTRTAVALLALVLPLGMTGCSDDSKQFERAVPAPVASTTASAPAASTTAPSVAASSAASDASSAPRSSASASASQATEQASPAPQVTVTVQASSGPGEGGGESDGEGSDGSTWYRSSSGLYRSRQKICVQLEETWQAAVKAGKKSASIKAHDDAILAGCDPAVWTPNGVKHETVHESHYDGESCSSSEAGTVAIFDGTYAVCTQQVEDQWTWQVAEQ